jgi:hypothetical protein
LATGWKSAAYIFDPEPAGRTGSNPRSGAVVAVKCSILNTSENNLLLGMIRPHVGLGSPMEELNASSLQSRCTESDPVAADPSGNPHMSGVSFDPTWVRTLPAKLAGVPGAVAALGLMGAALSSPSHAQAPPLGTDGSFGVLAGTPSISNTGPSVITGDLGISPGAAVIGFPPGIVVGGTIHAADAVALQAKNDLVTAYNNLAGRPTTADLTGQNLGGLTLIAGVYAFTGPALLSTGNKTLTLDGQGNPNSIFIFNIGSTLTTASASNVLLINGAQAGNVFWRVGSSATLGTTTTFKVITHPSAAF